MFRKRSKFAVGAVLTLAMCSSAAGASAAPLHSVESQSTIVASQAFAAAGLNTVEGTDAAKPAAIPAVVAFAFAAVSAVGDYRVGGNSFQPEGMDPAVFD